MRPETSSPDEFRAHIAHEIEEIRNELEILRSRAEAQQASLSTESPSGQVSDRSPSTKKRTR